MNTFDRQWRALAARVRQEEGPPSDEPVPRGFAHRVWRLSQRPTPDLWSLLWLRFGLRTLVAVTLVLLLCTVIERRSRVESSSFRPPLENAVAERFGLL